MSPVKCAMVSMLFSTAVFSHVLIVYMYITSIKQIHAFIDCQSP